VRGAGGRTVRADRGGSYAPTAGVVADRGWPGPL